MMMTMANNATGRSAEILNAAANAISSFGPRNPVSHQQRRWKGYWSRFWCFGPQKRTKRIVPSFRIEEGNAIEFLPNGSQQLGGAHHPTTLSTSLLAPPSSPASLANSGNPSTVPSPAGFLSVASNSCSPGRLISTMFATGPYAHETQLVSPPVFSTFSTEPSTASFTPPPEMAHLTTPPSPEVPFAQLLASSLNTKATEQEHGLTFSSFPFISSGYGVTNDHLSYQLFPGSPAGSLLSPRTSSSFPDLEFPAQWKLLHYMQDSFFPRNESSNIFNQEMATSRSSMVSQDLDVFRSSTVEFHLDHACHQSESCEEQHSIGSHSLPTEADIFFQSTNIEEEQHMETNKCCTTSIYSSRNDITLKFPMESSQEDQSRSK